MGKRIVKRMTFAAVIAAIYFCLCLLEGNLASGPVANIRFAEGLAVFAFFCPEVILGTSIGCFLYNLFFGCGIIDALIGTVATVLGTGAIYLLGKVVKKDLPRLILFGLPLTILNGLLVPIVLILCLPDYSWTSYFVLMGTVIWGEAVAVYAVGIPLYFLFRKTISKIMK